ncbi:hypothetical protein CLV67_13584 [Actinoplanes italicus]|uniref:Uncharacterized protein n=1 Tax=Actinoplanes italicus TaxID=113567 RepID=A0A2T0JQV4_9ACTN|nr:hypothetical protein CLV67_13584 [Actinoplanes italicus]
MRVSRAGRSSHRRATRPGHRSRHLPPMPVWAAFRHATAEATGARARGPDRRADHPPGGRRPAGRQGRVGLDHPRERQGVLVRGAFGEGPRAPARDPVARSAPRPPGCRNTGKKAVRDRPAPAAICSAVVLPHPRSAKSRVAGLRAHRLPGPLTQRGPAAINSPLVCWPPGAGRCPPVPKFGRCGRTGLRGSLPAVVCAASATGHQGAVEAASPENAPPTGRLRRFRSTIVVAVTTLSGGTSLATTAPAPTTEP